MSTRSIRDGLLESESIRKLPDSGKWLYVTLLLTADDVGLFEAKPFRMAFKSGISEDQIDIYLCLLVDLDLVRVYTIGSERFGFIPKFRQRIQRKTLKYPPPPISLIQDEPETVNAINELADFRLSPTVGQPPEEKRREEKRREENMDAPRKRGARTPRPSREITTAALMALGIPEGVALDWLEIRARKRLTLTETAVDEVRSQASKAGLTLAEAVRYAVAKGWGHFTAAWYQRNEGTAAVGGNDDLFDKAR